MIGRLVLGGARPIRSPGAGTTDRYAARMPDIPHVTAPEGGWRDWPNTTTPVTAAEMTERDDTINMLVDALNTGIVPDGLAALIATGGSAPPSFTWVQNDPAAVWTITHPLGYRPAGVQVFHTGDTSARLVPIEYPNTHTVIVRHGAPARGIALLS